MGKPAEGVTGSPDPPESKKNPFVPSSSGIVAIVLLPFSALADTAMPKRDALSNQWREGWIRIEGIISPLPLCKLSTYQFVYLDLCQLLSRCKSEKKKGAGNLQTQGIGSDTCHCHQIQIQIHFILSPSHHPPHPISSLLFPSLPAPTSSTALSGLVGIVRSGGGATVLLHVAAAHAKWPLMAVIL